MNQNRIDVGREIAILSLGQILAISEENIENQKAREMLERHIRQVAAIVQGKPHNKPDAETEDLLVQVRALLRSTEREPIAVAG